MTTPNQKRALREPVYEAIEPDTDRQLLLALQRSDYAAIRRIINREDVVLSVEIGESTANINTTKPNNLIRN